MSADHIRKSMLHVRKLTAILQPLYAVERFEVSAVEAVAVGIEQVLVTIPIDIGEFNLRLDNVLMLAAGALVVVGLQYLLNRTKLGLAIRAVAQDEETARTMGINFTVIVLITFALGSGLAAFAGVMNGLYYNEINFGIGLYLGVIGFSAAIIGGLGSVYGAILGGFLFAGLQTVGTVLLPFASAYKEVFAFAVVIAIMAWRPTGLVREKISERV